MKLAKLQIKLTLAIFLTGHEFGLVDKDGKFPDPLPVPDPNGFRLVRMRLWIICTAQMLIVSVS